MRTKGLLMLIGSVCLALMLVVPIVAGCAASTPTPTPLPTFTWNLATFLIGGNTPFPQLEAMAQRVAERTDGKFKIHVAPDGELGIHRDSFNETLASGVLELCDMSSALVERVIPSVGIHQLPQLAVDPEGWNKVWEALGDRQQSAFKEVGYQLVAPGAVYVEFDQQMYSKEAIPDLSNLRGYKVRVWQNSMEEVVAALGGEPVYMAVSEVFMAMQRGVVDAYITGLSAAVAGSAWDVASQYYPVAFPGGKHFIVISTKALETLPDEYKTILIEEASKWGEEASKARDAEVDKAVATLEEHGMTINELTSAERESWKEASIAYWDEWTAGDPSKVEALKIAKEALGWA